MAHSHESSLGLVRVLRVSLRGAVCFARAGMSTSHANAGHSRIQQQVRACVCEKGCGAGSCSGIARRWRHWRESPSSSTTSLLFFLLYVPPVERHSVGFRFDLGRFVLIKAAAYFPGSPRRCSFPDNANFFSFHLLKSSVSSRIICWIILSIIRIQVVSRVFPRTLQ